MSHTISKTIELDAGHRVPLHESKCKNLHGHRYSVQLTVTGPIIAVGSETGMVKDFSFMKDLLNLIVHDPCDHSLILAADDVMLPALLGPQDRSVAIVIQDIKSEMMFEHSCKVMLGIDTTRIYIIKSVPTAENLAKHWGMRLIPHLAEVGVELASLDIWETPSSVATWSPT